jgi:hypothetical protein
VPPVDILPKVLACLEEFLRIISSPSQRGCTGSI